MIHDPKEQATLLKSSLKIRIDSLNTYKNAIYETNDNVNPPTVKHIKDIETVDKEELLQAMEEIINNFFTYIDT